MTRKYTASVTQSVGEWDETWALAIVFGLASVPWTYGFVAGLDIPLWPSFIASATYYATDETGVQGLLTGYASNVSGIAYAAATLVIVGALFNNDAVALSAVVGVFMFLASLHAFVPLLSFTPGAFFGYATMFSVHSVDVTVLGFSGLAGETLAATVAMLIGALIGYTADITSEAIE